MIPLTWKNDPLLLDSKTTQINEWVTANDLLSMELHGNNSNANKDLASIEGNWFSSCNNSVCSLNLYSILVRKIDFVRKKTSDRILARFPFLVLSEEENELIQKNILLIAECARNYFYKSINSGIMDWKRRLLTYLKRGAMPYPLYRCSCEVLDLPLVYSEVDKIFFESARGKGYSVPAKITNALAYLCGVCNGDGHLKRHWLRIVDETKAHIDFLSKVFELLFSDSGEIFKSNDCNAWNVELRCSAAVRLINFLTDQTIAGAKYDSLREPLLFKILGEPFRNYYWGGVMDADGSFKRQISLTSVSGTYVRDLQDYLSTYNFDTTIHKISDFGYSLYLQAKHKVEFVKKIGVLNPKKAADYQDFLQKKRITLKYVSIKSEALTPEGFFNLELMDPFQIIGLGSFLQKYRGTKSYKAICEELDISVGYYTRYEKEKHALPFEILKCIVSNYEDNSQIYKILKKNSVRFQTSNSTPIKLPLLPSKNVVKILPLLEPKLSFVKLTIAKPNNIELIKTIFDTLIVKDRINSRLLVHFLNTFCNYNYIDFWLSSTDYQLIIQNWRKELLK